MALALALLIGMPSSMPGAPADAALQPLPATSARLDGAVATAAPPFAPVSAAAATAAAVPLDVAAVPGPRAVAAPLLPPAPLQQGGRAPDDRRHHQLAVVVGRTPLTPEARQDFAFATPSAAGAASLERDAAAAGARGSCRHLAPGHGAAAAGGLPRGLQSSDVVHFWQRLHSFMACVSTSPLVQSALLSLEVCDAHPPLHSAASQPPMQPRLRLPWTLASLFGVFFKAGYRDGEQGVREGGREDG